MRAVISEGTVEHTRMKKPYNCDICGKSFTQNYNLSKHYRMHSGETLYKCKVCGKAFHDSGNLTKHHEYTLMKGPINATYVGNGLQQIVVY